MLFQKEDYCHNIVCDTIFLHKSTDLGCKSKKKIGKIVGVVCVAPFIGGRIIDLLRENFKSEFCLL